MIKSKPGCNAHGRSKSPQLLSAPQYRRNISKLVIAGRFLSMNAINMQVCWWNDCTAQSLTLGSSAKLSEGEADLPNSWPGPLRPLRPLRASKSESLTCDITDWTSVCWTVTHWHIHATQLQNTLDSKRSKKQNQNPGLISRTISNRHCHFLSFALGHAAASATGE